MSCGKPHETDCAEVLAEVWLFLDHECDAARRKLLERHLDECTPCLARVRPRREAQEAPRHASAPASTRRTG